MKVKRIDLIAKGEITSSEITADVKKSRINRAIEAALDQALEEKESADMQAIKALEYMSQVGSVADINACINQYCTYKNNSENWNKMHGWILGIKKYLEEVVEVEK